MVVAISYVAEPDTMKPVEKKTIDQYSNSSMVLNWIFPPPSTCSGQKVPPYDEGKTLLASGKCLAHRVLTAANLKYITVPVVIPVRINQDRTLVMETMQAVSVWVPWLWFNDVAPYHEITGRSSISTLRTILGRLHSTVWRQLFQEHYHPVCKSTRYLAHCPTCVIIEVVTWFSIVCFVVFFGQITLMKDSVYEDFGFSVSDGLYERGIYVNRVRKGGPADISGQLLAFDRILQVLDWCTATQQFLG